MKETQKLYVRRRWIMRQGKRIRGWQVGFTADKTGGCTSSDRQTAIDAQVALLRRWSDKEPEIVDV